MDKWWPAPSNLKSTVSQHFGLYEEEGKGVIDKSHTLCKLCRAKFKYFGNTTDMKKHIMWFHPELEKHHSAPIAATVSFTQSTLEQVAKLPPNSEKVKQITWSVAGFTAKDLCPYSPQDFTQCYRCLSQGTVCPHGVISVRQWYLHYTVRLKLKSYNNNQYRQGGSNMWCMYINYNRIVCHHYGTLHYRWVEACGLCSANAGYVWKSYGCEYCWITAQCCKRMERSIMNVLLLKKEEVHFCSTVCWDRPSLMLQLHHIISQPVP